MNHFHITIIFLFLPLFLYAQLTLDATDELQQSKKSGILHKPFLWNSFPFKPKLESSKNSLLSCENYKGISATAFFCRMEDRLEKKVKLPVRMRLGSLDYVDQLEQKRTYKYEDWMMDHFED